MEAAQVEAKKKKEIVRAVETEEVVRPGEIKEVAQAAKIEAGSEKENIQGPAGETLAIQQAGREITREQKIEAPLKTAKDYFDNGQYQQAIDAWRDVLALDVYNTEAKEGIDKARAELEKAQKEQMGEDEQDLMLIYGIIGKDDKAAAVVNSKILEVGDLIDGKEVVDISSKGITLKDGDGEKEEINLKKQE